MRNIVSLEVYVNEVGKESKDPIVKPLLQPDPTRFSPSDYMRARRPELFSDSKVLVEPLLSREVFEYHLDSLTSRKQEYEFEYFCRRLAEKELCPNLLPQTGPSGGGDGKVDTETYPVAEEISLGWYEGVAREAAQERWAFAFSAKKDWRSKVRSDVEKIEGTGRGYKVSYFITNQFAKASSRAKVEDELKKKHGLEVRILDRTWIVKCVFEHGRLEMAIDALALSEHKKISHKTVGPRDTEREAALRELEEQIDDIKRYSGVEYQLVEDCLQAAFLARGLELPRPDIEGRFSRAERLAERFGTRQQRLRIAYCKAWTAHWWYDDLSELNRLYDRVEALATGSERAYDLELLTNLWQVLNAASSLGQIDSTKAKLSDRTATLRTELDRLSKDDSRSSNALLARTNKVLMKLHEAVQHPEHLDMVFSEVRKILKLGDGLINYPIDTLTTIIRELGQSITKSDKFDQLFEFAVSLAERRTGEGTAGLMLLQRGYQNLAAGLWYEAIRLLGRAQKKLAKHEYQDKLIEALAHCSYAYERAGLLWAARANIIAAANQTLHEFWQHGDILPQALFCLQRLVWIELQLGRVTCALAWIELADVIAHQLMLESDKKKHFTDQRERQDLILGLLLLKTDFFELKWLENFPDVLDHNGLIYARAAVLYALGHEDQLRMEHYIPDQKDSHAVQNFFANWLNQPAKDDLPDKPEFLRGRKVSFRSFVLGCEIKLDAENNLDSIYLSEAILGALEGLLATSLDTHLLPYREKLEILVQQSEMAGVIPKYEIKQTEGERRVEILHAPLMPLSSMEEQEAFGRWLMEIILVIVAQIALTDDFKSYFDKLAKEEAGFERALSFSISSVFVKNLLGDKPKLSISGWLSEIQTKKFPLERDVPWTHSLPVASKREIEPPVACKPGEGEPPEALFGVDNLRHRDRRVLSVINIPLWDKARWKATAYLFHPSPQDLPILVLGFQEAEAAKLIFKGWRDRFGPVDTSEQLSISIIRGINRAAPANYKVVIGSIPKIHTGKSDSTNVIIVTRFLQMEPPNSMNLDSFLEQYKLKGKYIIAPGHFKDKSTMPGIFMDLGIEKCELHLKQAWEIGRNELELCAISEDDDPIIPEGIKDPPLLRALKSISRRRKRQ